jgi:hypothetical protein
MLIHGFKMKIPGCMKIIPSGLMFNTDYNGEIKNMIFVKNQISKYNWKLIESML